MDGIDYSSKNDWRSAYCSLSGLIAVFESERKAPGKKFIYFFPKGSAGQQQEWLQTSLGDLQIIDDIYMIVTRNSKYIFRRDDDIFTPEEKNFYI